MSYRDSYRTDNRSYGGRGRGGSRGFGNSRPGDWDCQECGFMNYASRDECRDCKAAKPQSGNGGYDRQRSRSPTERSYDKPKSGGYGGDSGRYRDNYDSNRNSSFGRGRGGSSFGNDRGDNWTCPNPKCEFSNFAKRFKCMKCDEPKPNNTRSSYNRDFSRNAPRPGDWECQDCGFNNYASRDVCFKCNTPK